MNDVQINRLGVVLMAAAYAGELVKSRINEKRFEHNLTIARELQKENEQLREALQSSVAQTSYLLVKLDEAEVPPSEFDIIVLNSLT